MNSTFLWMVSVMDGKICSCDSTKVCTQNSAVWLYAQSQPAPPSSQGPATPAHRDVLDPVNV